MKNTSLSAVNFSSAHRREFRRDIQGLRAIAVTAVIIFHACKTWLPSGFVGVDVFFVISGYIVTSLIIDGQKKFHWRDFFLSRIKRILPAYIVMVAFVTIVSSLLFLDNDFEFYKKSMEYSLVFLSNLYFSDFGNYFGPGAYELPLLHTWSLAIEMQFYILLPVLIWLVPRRWLPWVMGMICALLLTYSQWRLGLQDSQRVVYYALFSRAPEFMIGALVAVAKIGSDWSNRANSFAGWVGLISLFVCFMAIDENHFPGLISLVPTVATALLIASRKGFISQLLSTSALVWIGALSYSLYLWHWPILAFMRYYHGRYDLPGLWLLGFILITFLLSWLSYRWVETLARNSKGILAKPMGISALVIVAAVVMLGSIPLHAMVEKPLPLELTQYAPAAEICHGKIIGNCLQGDLMQKPTVLVLGDSHAAQLNEFFNVVGKRNGFSARIITASNCVPIPGFDVERIPDYSRADCRSQMAALSPYLDSANIIVVAAMWQWQAPNEKFMHALNEFIKFTTKRNIKVVVLAQVPMFDVNLLRVRRFFALGLSADVNQNKDWKKANSDVSMLVRGNKNVEFLDFSNSQFFSNAPFYNEKLIYMDNHHLNEVGARSYGMFAAPYLQKILISTH
ncbi:acyltransferase family protein [Pseudomonas sp. AU8050]|uniref:acyltransferase family protein n=1 Tax=Pseudomonas sp. AU8050 TaxID=2681497 RepID=UPI001408C572